MPFFSEGLALRELHYNLRCSAAREPCHSLVKYNRQLHFTKNMPFLPCSYSCLFAITVHSRLGRQITDSPAAYPVAGPGARWPRGHTRPASQGCDTTSSTNARASSPSVQHGVQRRPAGGGQYPACAKRGTRPAPAQLAYWRSEYTPCPASNPVTAAHKRRYLPSDCAKNP